ITPRYFPERSNDIPNRPELALAVIAPEQPMQDADTLKRVETLIRESGSSDRTFKSAVIVAIADSDVQLREEARKLLAWEDIRDEEPEGLDDSQKRQLQENVDRAKRDLREAIWRAYKHIVLLGKDNKLQAIDLGRITSSGGGASMTSYLLQELRKVDQIQDRISASFLVRNWPPAFTEWSTRSLRDACFASPQFPRLLDPNSIKLTIAEGVSGGTIAYVGKTDDRYHPFKFKESLSPDQIEISDDLFIITAKVAEAYQQRITEPPRLATLTLIPQQVQIQPGVKQTFTVQGRDQYGSEIATGPVQWSATGSTIDQNGVLTAGSDPGSFVVTANVGEIRGTDNFIVPTKAAKEGEGDYPGKEGGDSPPIKPPPPEPKGLSWKGEIPAQKWSNFYMRVLSKFAADKNLKLTLKVEISAEGEVSEQKFEETKTALHELGLEGELDTH
ncbi:MAG: hypothetical protein WCA35_10125, partial [Kovacikia sp.]